MAYILKNTSGLINTRVTDTGRQKLSEGNFNIAYFQIGDSEVCYNGVTNYNQTNNYILEAAYNAQNTSSGQQVNKMHIKYPLLSDHNNKFGIVLFYHALQKPG